MWLARIFSSLCLLRTNAGKPQNEKRGRGKNTEYPIQGKMLLPRKVISWIHRARAWLSGSLPPEKQQGQIFQSRLSFPSFPIHLRHKLIYSFIQNLFTFQESVIRKPVCSAVPYVPRSGCRSAPWHGTRTSLNLTLTPEENRGVSTPINQLPLFWGYLIVEQLTNGNDCNLTLNVTFPTLPQQRKLFEHCFCGGLKSSQNRSSEACPRLYTEYKSMQHVYIDSAFFPPPTLPDSTHTKPLHQGEYCCDEALEWYLESPYEKAFPSQWSGTNRREQVLRTPSPLGQAVVAQSWLLHRKSGLVGKTGKKLNTDC